MHYRDISAIKITSVVFAAAPGHSVPTRRATISEWPRLVVGLDGRRHHRFAGAAQSVTLDPGQALYVGPDCWLDTWYDCDNDALSVVFAKPRARVLFLEYRWLGDKGRTMRATPNPALFVSTVAKPSVARFLDELAAASAKPGWYAANVAECLLFHIAEALREPDPSSSGKAEARFHLLRYYVDEHCQEGLSREEVGAALGIHPSHVSRLFSRFSDTGFSEYVNVARVARAQRLLVDGTKTVSEVAFQCGFSSPSYFTRVFRSRVGASPLEYRMALPGKGG